MQQPESISRPIGLKPEPVKLSMWSLACFVRVSVETLKLKPQTKNPKPSELRECKPAGESAAPDASVKLAPRVSKQCERSRGSPTEKLIQRVRFLSRGQREWSLFLKC